MKTARLLLLPFFCFLSLGLAKDEIIADMTCQAETGLQSELGIPREWKGEFFSWDSKDKL